MNKNIKKLCEKLNCKVGMKDYEQCYECEVFAAAELIGGLEEKNAELHNRHEVLQKVYGELQKKLAKANHDKKRYSDRIAELRKQLETRKDLKSKREIGLELLKDEKQGKTHYSIHYFIDLLDFVETYYDENQELRKQVEKYEKFEREVLSKEWELEAWCCDCDKESMKREIESLKAQLSDANLEQVINPTCNNCGKVINDTFTIDTNSRVSTECPHCEEMISLTELKGEQMKPTKTCKTCCSKVTRVTNGMERQLVKTIIAVTVASTGAMGRLSTGRTNDT